MNNKFLGFCFCLLVLASCEKEQPLSFSAESFTEKDLAECNNGDCPEITVNYFTVQGEERVSEKINAEIEQFIIASLKTTDEDPNAKGMKQAARNFVATYRKDLEQFPDMVGEYVSEINVRNIFENDQLLSVEEQQYTFTGGAHGYGSTTFDNFDPKTGALLQQKDLFKDWQAFKEFAENEFRKQHNISENESINATGFWFENDTFYVPENIGFTKDNVIIIYNQYDIASYADGPIELEIPMEKAKEFLDFSVE
ncbi:DUF3298 and DUF4163 domain-containing protein [Marixanthomonas spongiae]|nr:DUF3298 and DUF4163 domain-containing protein [Marixanthomonas spongiae]